MRSESRLSNQELRNRATLFEMAAPRSGHLFCPHVQQLTSSNFPSRFWSDHPKLQPAHDVNSPWCLVSFALPYKWSRAESDLETEATLLILF
jgi:hypothetical protein